MAYSGGRDSTALLHATLGAAEGCGVRVVALHVHHGLSVHADAWLAHCEAQCRRWRRRGRPVDFAAHRLGAKPAPGESIEAWARAERYAALGTMARAHGARVVLLAQHRRDQAETFLLQALRGAGTAGLAGMPERVERDGIVWQRPWLHRSRDEIEAYVRRHRLSHIDDDSNDDARYARNRLRLEVWPALGAAFPQAELALANSAQWAAQADAALQELAALDMAPLLADDAGLRIAPWRALSEARRGNVLRAWLHRALDVAPPASLSTRLAQELAHARSARWPAVGGELRLYRGVLRLERDTPAAPIAPRETRLSISRAGLYELPGWGGAISARSVRSGGVPYAWLAKLDLHERTGGERFQLGVGRPPRSLKKQFQSLGVPAWQRAVPLVWSGGQLVFVPGLGLDARVIGLPGQAQAQLEWVVREPPGPMLRRSS